jgi:phospholipid/cholesterol/gamma-HCH transport system ATP-binding protein
MLNVTDIRKNFGTKEVLRGVNFTLAEHTIAGLIGPSGGGKSVLLKILSGVAHPRQGEIHFDTAERPTISLMFQEGALFDSLCVFDNVAFPLVGGKVPAVGLPKAVRDEVYEKVSVVLSRVGLSKAAFKMPAEISGGMRRRASLARALVNRPQILLLDDPTSGLDPVASSVIMNLIVELHRDYRPTTLMVSHDLRRLFPAVEKIVALFEGTICFEGTLDELRDHGHVELQRFVSCRYDLNSKSAVHQPAAGPV